jgi:hypothetical protein
MPPDRSQTECPNCHRQFDTPAAVLGHLNHPYSTCSRWFLPPDSQPTSPSSSTQDDLETSPHIAFPFLGHVFGKGPSFLDNFCSDKFSGNRSRNLYHPFMSKEEWELAAFLTQSDLSMKVIDSFLSLEMVRLNAKPLPLLPYNEIARYGTSTSLSGPQKRSVIWWSFFPVGLSGSRRRSTFQVIPPRIR